MIRRVLFATFVLFSNLIYAQIRVTPELNKAIEEAIDKSAQIKNNKLDVEKLHLEKESIKSKHLPHLSAIAAYSYFDTDLTLDLETITLPIIGLPLFDDKAKLGTNGNFFLGGINATSVLFAGNQIKYGSKAIEQKAIGTAYLAEIEEDNLIKEVINTFDQIELLNQIEILLDDSEKRLQTERFRVEKAIKNGLAIPYDRDKIKLAELEINSKRIELEGNRDLVYQKLNYLTNYSPEEIKLVNYELEPYFLLTEKNQTTENRKELKALEAFKEAYSLVKRKEKGTLLPTLAVFGSYSYASAFSVDNKTERLPIIDKKLNLGIDELTLHPTFMVGVMMKWDIFTGFNRKYNIEEAEININQMENQIQDTKEKINLQLAQNLSKYEVENKKLDVANQQVKIAENNLNLAIKQYREGLIDISERLVAENDLYMMKVNQVNTIIQQRLSAIEVEKAAGNIKNSLIITNEF